MSEPRVLCQIDGSVAVLTLNRPDKLNALDRSTLVELDRHLVEVLERADVRGVILTGSGDKAFAAGADIAELAALSPVQAREHALFGQSVFSRIESAAKPVIAAVNGFALGGGCELAMSAHLRLAADTASFGQPELKLGLIPGFAGTQRLTRLVGRSQALELLLTAARIKAARALEMGLVNRVVPAAELMTASRTLMGEILALAPLAVAATLEAVQVGLEAGFAEGCRHEASLFGLMFATADMREGTAAFQEKRQARFEGE